MEGHLKFLGRVGSSSPTFQKQSMKLNWNFLGGQGMLNKKLSVKGVLDIFWNCTIRYYASMSSMPHFFFPFHFFFWHSIFKGGGGRQLLGKGGLINKMTFKGSPY